MKKFNILENTLKEPSNSEAKKENLTLEQRSQLESKLEKDLERSINEVETGKYITDSRKWLKKNANNQQCPLS